MSLSGQQHNPTPVHGPLRRAPRGALSKVAGAGAGSGLIVLAEKLGLGPGPTVIVQACAPWLAVLVAAVGPHLMSYVVHQAKYFGLSQTLRSAKKFAASTTPGTPSAEVANQNVQELEMLIVDLIRAEARFFTRSS